MPLVPSLYLGPVELLSITKHSQTRLVVAACTQLRLARGVAPDQRLAWERVRAPGKLTPTRVHRAFPKRLVALGSPAGGPKPSGYSP